MDDSTRNFLACVHEAEKQSAAVKAHGVSQSCKPHPASLEFAAAVQERRKALGWSRKGLAALIRVGDKRLDALEQGRIKPSSELARQVRAALGMEGKHAG